VEKHIMPNMVDLTGKKFGRLVVKIPMLQRKAGQVVWECHCTCPQKTIVKIMSRNLVTGRTKSCGCLQREVVSNVMRTHGLTNDRMYKKWEDIKSRCFNKNNPRYTEYGGRGITLHTPWLLDPVAFVEYVKALPGSDNPILSLDRIDNNKDYEPGNLQWATAKQQANNRSNNIPQERVAYIQYLLKNSCLSKTKIKEIARQKFPN